MRSGRLEELITRLRERGYRLTPQRIGVLEILAVSRGHPSVESIYRQLRERYPTVSLATVYNTVQLLRDMGEVLELGFADGSSRYDGKRPMPHPHLVCTRCGRIADLDLDATSGLPAEVGSMTGWDVTSHRLDFFGRCPMCRAARTTVGDDSH